MNMSIEKENELFKYIFSNDMADNFFFNNNKLYINCSDIFVWGSADTEELKTLEDFELLKDCVLLVEEIEAPLLYCVRKRKMRPQGAIYKHIDKKYWDIFNSFGEYRKIGIGNPLEIGE